MFCGAPTGGNQESPTKMASVSFVPARCTNCGGILQVDPNQEAAVCQFCHTPFIVEKAISNYNVTVAGNMQIANATVNVQGLDVKNLLSRAEEFVAQKKYRKAKEYFNKVLDIDINNSEARDGVSKMDEAIKNQPLYETPVATLFGGKTGRLFLMKDFLYYQNPKGKTVYFKLSDIKDIKAGMGDMLSFKIKVPFMGLQEYSYSIVGNAKEWVRILNEAILYNIYPKIEE